MGRRKAKDSSQTKYRLKVIELPDNINIEILYKLFNNISFVKFDKNKNNLEAQDDCWVRGVDPSEYTTIRIDGKQKQAHRVSYQIFNKVRLEHFGCHHCDTPACINPNHIFDGTHEDNRDDALRKGRWHNPKTRQLMIESAERILRNKYPNEVVKIEVKNDLIERFSKLVGDV